MKSFEQATGVNHVTPLNSGAKMGPSGDTCHMQVPGVAGHSSPSRTKTKNPNGGYHVTSPAATPSINKDLAKRP